MDFYADQAVALKSPGSAPAIETLKSLNLRGPSAGSGELQLDAHLPNYSSREINDNGSKCRCTQEIRNITYPDLSSVIFEVVEAGQISKSVCCAMAYHRITRLPWSESTGICRTRPTMLSIPNPAAL